MIWVVFHFIPFNEDGTRKYINQFGGDCGFSYKPNQTQEYLYSYLAIDYKCIKFVYVHKDNKLSKEKEYANREKAVYWRNGGPYKSAIIKSI